MTILREFCSNFTKIKRTPMLLLHLLLPVAVTALFLAYYAVGGYRIIPDVRSFFILVLLCYPIFVGITVPVFTRPDRTIHGTQNALGLVASRKSVYLGKLLFLLFFSAINVIIYEVCFYIGVTMFLNMDMTSPGLYAAIFCIFILSSLFTYLLHLPAAFRFGSSISVLLGISGTILAGLFENPIGDKIWMFIPWEWGIRFLESYLNMSDASVLPGIISMLLMTLAILVLSLLWFDRWEGRSVQE